MVTTLLPLIALLPIPSFFAIATVVAKISERRIPAIGSVARLAHTLLRTTDDWTASGTWLRRHGLSVSADHGAVLMRAQELEISRADKRRIAYAAKVKLTEMKARNADDIAIQFAESILSGDNVVDMKAKRA